MHRSKTEVILRTKRRVYSFKRRLKLPFCKSVDKGIGFFSFFFTISTFFSRLRGYLLKSVEGTLSVYAIFLHTCLMHGFDADLAVREMCKNGAKQKEAKNGFKHTQKRHAKKRGSGIA